MLRARLVAGSWLGADEAVYKGFNSASRSTADTAILAGQDRCRPGAPGRSSQGTALPRKRPLKPIIKRNLICLSTKETEKWKAILMRPCRPDRRFTLE